MGTTYSLFETILVLTLGPLIAIVIDVAIIFFVAFLIIELYSKSLIKRPLDEYYPKKIKK